MQVGVEGLSTRRAGQAASPEVICFFCFWPQKPPAGDGFRGPFKYPGVATPGKSSAWKLSKSRKLTIFGNLFPAERPWVCPGTTATDVPKLFSRRTAGLSSEAGGVAG